MKFLCNKCKKLIQSNSLDNNEVVISSTRGKIVFYCLECYKNKIDRSYIE